MWCDDRGVGATVITLRGSASFTGDLGGSGAYYGGGVRSGAFNGGWGKGGVLGAVHLLGKACLICSLLLRLRLLIKIKTIAREYLYNMHCIVHPPGKFS